jgi:nucleoside-diphosphate-sugar epimerase
MKKPSVSLTGATGFVGRHVAEAFIREGWHVRAIVRPDSRHAVPEGSEARVSRLDAKELAVAFADSALVVHCAGIVRAPNEAAFTKINVEGTRAVVQAANQIGARVTLISSLAAGGTGTKEHPREERDLPAPINAYGRSKLAGEEVVRAEARVPWTVVRPCAVYGPRDRGFLPLFQAARRGLFFLPTSPRTPFSLIDVRDLARAIVAASTSGSSEGRTLFAAHPTPHDAAGMMSILANIYGHAYRLRTIPTPLLRAAAALGDLMWKFDRKFVIDGSRYTELTAEGFVCSVDQLREVAGFTAPTSLEQGFRETASWYDENGWV